MNLSVEERVDLFELAAYSIDPYENNRIYSYCTGVRLLLDALLTFEETCDNPHDAIGRLEQALKIIEDKIQKKQSYQLVMRQIGAKDS